MGFDRLFFLLFCCKNRITELDSSTIALEEPSDIEYNSS